MLVSHSRDVRVEIQDVPIISDPVGYGWEVKINSWSYFGQDFIKETVTDVKYHLLIYTKICFSESDSGAENPAGIRKWIKMSVHRDNIS